MYALVVRYGREVAGLFDAATRRAASRENPQTGGQHGA
jgi:hypothetical protein